MRPLLLAAGDSTGSPSEAGLLEDAYATYRYAVTVLRAQEIVVWGHSLGTGVTMALLARLSRPYLTPAKPSIFLDPAGSKPPLPLPLCVFLEAPYCSLPTTAANHWVGWPLRCVPARWRQSLLERLVIRFDSEARLTSAQIDPSVPLAVLHCKDDRVIAVEHGQRLASVAAASGMKNSTSIIVSGCGHNSVSFSPAIVGPVREFLATAGISVQPSGHL